MRKAIIISNPKWTTFAEASEKFKKQEPKDGEVLILVVSDSVKTKASKLKVETKKEEKK